MEILPLTLLSSAGGCAAKVGPRELHEILDGLWVKHGQAYSPLQHDEDAGAFEILKGNCIVQSIDMITPVSDNPTVYGAIAVAHALSDIYAKGAQPITGLFVLGFPALHVSMSTAKEIIQGAVDKLVEAKAVLLKGHTISSHQLEFGVAITGLLQNEFVMKKNCKDGDALILTKPLGNGIVTMALKLANSQMPIASFATEIVKTSEKIMLETNSVAAETMIEIGINACTDVSGFGLIGHLKEMLNGGSAALDFDAVPIIRGVIDLANQEIVTGGGEKNAAYWWDSCMFDGRIRYAQKMVLFDPQTSGGLLISVEDSKADYLITCLKNRGVAECAIIGHTLKGRDSKIVVS